MSFRKCAAPSLAVLLYQVAAGVGCAVAQQPAAAAGAAARTCRVVEAAAAIPAAVLETSGLARSRRNPALLWTHNDGPHPELFAISADRQLVARVTVRAPATDWEDIESFECDDGPCLFIGDIGDNDDARETIAILRLQEPPAVDGSAVAATVLRARYPDGAQDAESLFVLPGGALYIITKGRDRAVTLYRYPAPHRPEETVVLERVRELAPDPEDRLDRVTAATASPDGRFVAVRTYRRLAIYRAADLIGTGDAAPHVVADLGALHGMQGEAVALGDDGTVWLSSEAASAASAMLSRLQCDIG